VLTPTAGDTPLAVKELASHGIPAHACGDMEDVSRCIADGVGALLIAEEALGAGDRAQLLAALDEQPVWSDLPVVLLVSPGELSGSLSVAVQDVVRRGNVTLLERPVRVATLTTALDAALRARARQYEMRDAIIQRATSIRQLSESEERLRATVEAAPFPLMVHADDGTIVHMSRTWYELTGYSPEQLTTLDAWTALAYGDDAEAARAIIREDLASERPLGVSTHTWEHPVRTRNGSLRQWSFHAARLGHMSDGRALRLVAAVDVTDMRRLVANERTLRAEAEQANMAKMQFLATMSHELRTPLNAIGGHVQLIELGILGPVTEKQADALRRVRRAEAHLLGLINDVLNFAKIEAGHVTIEVAPMTIGQLFEGMDSLIEPQVRAKGLTYSRPTRCDDVRVLADLDKARQVLLNLLSNAVKFTRAGGSITVECRPRETMVEINVIDTGVGVAAEALASIFEPFVQVRPDYTTTNEGTGLGLTISRDLARAMNGELSARSVKGKGSTFTLTLPMALEH
jgi:PAS domain S-box-containing protein